MLNQINLIPESSGSLLAVGSQERFRGVEFFAAEIPNGSNTNSKFKKCLYIFPLLQMSHLATIR